MKDILFAELIIIGANLINVKIDAYKIMKHKNVAHGINGLVATTVAFLCAWAFAITGWLLIPFVLNAFSNRQLSFDIPLNKRRGLSAFYVSDNPASWWDRWEKRIISKSGKKQVLFYSILYAATLIFLLAFH